MAKINCATVTPLVLAMVAALTGCAHAPLMFEKQDVAEAEVSSLLRSIVMPDQLHEGARLHGSR